MQIFLFRVETFDVSHHKFQISPKIFKTNSTRTIRIFIFQNRISLQPCDSSLATLFTVEQYNLQRNDALICAEIYFSDVRRAGDN